MLARIITWVGAKALNRWILGGVVTLLLGGSAIMWHNHKENLRDEGRFQCVQAINEQTVIDLQTLLAAEQVVAAELRALATVDAAVNADARARLRVANESLKTLALQMKEQKKNDEEYAAWSAVSLPNGVAERLRQVNTGRDSDPRNEDSN